MRKETFFRINRWYLLSSLLVGILIPLLKYINFSSEIIAYNEQFISFVPMGIEIRDAPVSIAQGVESTQLSPWNIWPIINGIYFMVMLLFVARLIRGLFKIYSLYHHGAKTDNKDYSIITTSEYHLPFSFFKTVFISSKADLGQDYNRILQHELEHVRSMHTIDILLVECLHIIFWFHPLIYLYKSSIRQTHEYLADSAAHDYNSRTIYGQLLLRQSLSGLETALVHHFFHSHIKKRINMIYQSKSGRSAWLKYILAVPAFFILTSIFIGQNNHLATHVNFELITPLTKKNKSKLEKEVKALFDKHKDQSNWNFLQNGLHQLLDTWSSQFPDSARDIQRTALDISLKEKGIFFFYGQGGQNEIILFSPTTFNNEINDESWPMPVIQDIRSEYEANRFRENQSFVKLIQIYISYLPNYGKSSSLLNEFDQVFTSFLKEEKIELGFDIKELNPRFNLDLESSIGSFTDLTRTDNVPVIWCKDNLLNRPLKESIDFNKPIGMFVHLSPQHAEKVFGPKGKLGFYALLEHELPLAHPYVQRKQMIKEIENFFTTIGQLPENNWANKLKSVHKSLTERYPKVRDVITPFTTIAHRYNINLVFKNGEISRAYKSTPDGYRRLDGVDKKIPQVTSSLLQDTIIKFDPYLSTVSFIILTYPEDIRDEVRNHPIKINFNSESNLVRSTGEFLQCADQISLEDEIGNIISSIKLTNDSVVQDITELPKGVYFINVQQDNATIRVRFVKE